MYFTLVTVYHCETAGSYRRRFFESDALGNIVERNLENYRVFQVLNVVGSRRNFILVLVWMIFGVLVVICGFMYRGVWENVGE